MLDNLDDSIVDLIHNMLNDAKTKIVICKDRDKNFEFAYLYNINTKYIKNTLLDLKKEDLKSIVQNTNENYPKGLLYIFFKNVELTNAVGEIDQVELYIKISILNKKIIVISFHETNH